MKAPDAYRAEDNESLSDESLAALAQDGDATAFACLLQRYERRLLNYAARLLGDVADAEDAAQETFLRVHLHLGRYNVSRPFRPWVYRIMTNLCKDKLRHRKRRPTERLSNADAIAVEDTTSPRAAAEAEETAQRLRAAIDKLPVKQRTVFLMARYDNLPYEEIAKTLYIPVGTVKSRMNKAVTFLLQQMKDTSA